MPFDERNTTDVLRRVNSYAAHKAPGYVGFPTYHAEDFNDGRGRRLELILLRNEQVSVDYPTVSELGITEEADTSDVFRKVNSYAAHKAPGFVGFPTFHAKDYNDGRGRRLELILLRNEQVLVDKKPKQELVFLGPIAPGGNPIHLDSFSVVGSAIPTDVVFEFRNELSTTTVKPTFIRPHLALISSLPTTLPVGPTVLRLTSPTRIPSNRVYVTISPAPVQQVKVFQPGRAKSSRYLIAFVANPAISSPDGSIFTPDPILSGPSGH